MIKERRNIVSYFLLKLSKNAVFLEQGREREKGFAVYIVDGVNSRVEGIFNDLNYLVTATRYSNGIEDLG